VERILQLSGGYPSLLRAVCEAYAAGCPLEQEPVRLHPAVQRRVDEFWADQPSQTDLESSGLNGNPLLLLGRPLLALNDSQLTAKENQLWTYLKAHPNRVCEKDDLIQAIWPEDVIFERGIRDDSLAQLVRRLREKIEPQPSSPQHIHTVPGRGYRFTP
jgi:DNA-binding response OmpR family regulator